MSSASPGFNITLRISLPAGLLFLQSNLTTSPAVDVSLSLRDDQTQLVAIAAQHSNFIAYGGLAVALEGVVGANFTIGDCIQVDAALVYYSANAASHDTAARIYNTTIRFPLVFVGYIGVQASTLDGRSNPIDSTSPGQIFTIAAFVTFVTNSSDPDNLTVVVNVRHSSSPELKTEDLVKLHQTTFNASVLVRVSIFVVFSPLFSSSFHVV